VARSLEKLPADRFESARAFADALANPGFTSTAFAQAAVGPGAVSMRGNRPFLIAAGIAAAALFIAGLGWLRPRPPQPIERFSLFLPDSQALGNVNGTKVAISPDGRTLVYVGGPEGDNASSGLWVRPMDQLRATRLAGTERAANPSFSPDGKRIAFSTVAPRALKVVPVAGGAVLTLTDSLVDAGGVSWGSDGYIYYDAHLEGDGVARIRETGGKPEIASRPDSSAQESYHNMPSALPNGRGVLMTIAHPGASAAGFDVGVLDTRTGKHKTLVRGLAARYSPSGHLLFVTADGMLMAAPFDADKLVMTGDPVLLTGGLSVRGNSRIDVSVSPTGVLVYTSGTALTGNRELVWVTRDGVATAVDSSWSGDMVGRPTLSPDGRAVAITMGQGASRQVWVKQLDRGPVSRVADAGWAPSWSPDGKDLVFSSSPGLQQVPADGSRLPAGLHSLIGGAPFYSPDGKWLLFNARGDIAGAQTAGDTTVKSLVSDNQIIESFDISPDGRWLAYASDETGTFQVYVRPFPDTKVAKRQVSVASGYAPRWSRNGRELFYYDTNGEFWVAEIAPGPVFSSGTPKRLFSAIPFGNLILNYFDVSPDGKRFLFTRSKLSGLTLPRQDELVLVQNFFEELRAKVK